MAAAKAKKLGAVLFRSRKKPLRGGHAIPPPHSGAVQRGIDKLRRRTMVCCGGADVNGKTTSPPTKSLKPPTSSNNNNSPLVLGAAGDHDHVKTTPSPHHTAPLVAAPPLPPVVEIQLSRSMALRAAMLKVRYADTIWKASTKLGDPNWKEEEEEAMKLRWRRQQIERERQAARVAVNNIQKTVEFNDAFSLMSDFHNLISAC